MKTLVIYPGSQTHDTSPFYLFNPDNGEVLEFHFCSGSWFAKGDLHDNRPERKEKWEKEFGDKTEAKFIDETSYDWDEIYAKNQQLKYEQEEK